MKFLREVPLDKITNAIMALEQEGFTLIYKSDSVEIWYNERCCEYDVKPLGRPEIKNEMGVS